MESVYYYYYFIVYFCATYADLRSRSKIVSMSDFFKCENIGSSLSGDYYIILN